MTPQDQWAEREAKKFDAIAEAIEAGVEGNLRDRKSPGVLHAATFCAMEAAVWRKAARYLRQPYAVAQERLESER